MIDTARIVELAKTVEVDEEIEGYTGYAIANVINKTFAAVGSNIRIEAQVVYNDMTSGKVNGIKSGPHNRVRYSKDEVEAYAAKYVAQHARVTNAVETDTDDEAQELVDADDHQELTTKEYEELDSDVEE